MGFLGFSRMVFIVIPMFMATGLTACIPTRVSAPPLPAFTAQQSNLTPAMVKMNIKKGETTMTDVISIFGAPNIATRDTSGREVWTYDVQRVAHSSASKEVSGGIAGGAGGIVGTTPVGGIASVGGSSRGNVGQVSSATFTLMITFSEDEKVEDYKMMSTKF